jgi:transposase
MPRTRSIPVILDSRQTAELKRLSTAKSEGLKRPQRARILLMASEGEFDGAIAKAVNLNKNSVRNTIKKFTSMGLHAALSDLSRSGRPATIGDDAKTWVKSQARLKPKDLGYAEESWTIKKLTSHIHDACLEAGHNILHTISPSKVWTILEEDELKSHRIQYHLERREPDFERRMNEVLILYKEVELPFSGAMTSNGIIVSYDEKPAIQAIADTAPDPLPGAEGCVSRDYEYERLGTIYLLAGLELISGEVTGLIRYGNNKGDFIDFLKVIDNKYENSEHIKIVLDNNMINTSKETRRYLDTKPGRFIFIFTPKNGSWLNLVESFFVKLTRARLKGIRVKTKEDLISSIYQYLDEINDEPVVNRWTFRMDEIQL